MRVSLLVFLYFRSDTFLELANMVRSMWSMLLACRPRLCTLMVSSLRTSLGSLGSHFSCHWVSFLYMIYTFWYQRNHKESYSIIWVHIWAEDVRHNQAFPICSHTKAISNAHCAGIGPRRRSEIYKGLIFLIAVSIFQREIMCIATYFPSNLTNIFP